MTDKQIIIDVCSYQGECSVSGCKRNDDGCFVRQLFEERYRAENQIVELNKKVKAKEQECEVLKDKLLKLLGKEGLRQSEKEFYEQQLDQLKAENDELRKSVRKNKDKRKNATEKYLKLKEYTNKNCNPFELDIEKAENKKLRQTLTEIKFWARELLKRTGQVVPYEIKQILQKISEVE